jgi:hypothetical protein
LVALETNMTNLDTTMDAHIVANTPKKMVKVWQAVGRPGSCGWSTSPTYCTLGEPDRIQSCWQSGSVGYCEEGSNCGGTFTDAEMAGGTHQVGGACNTMDIVHASCNSDDCSAPAVPANQQY